MSDWIQITVSCQEADNDLVSDSLSDCGALSVTYQSAGTQQILEPAPDEAPLWQDIRVTGLFAQNSLVDQITACLQKALPAKLFDTLEQAPLEDRVWERECLNGLEAMKFGRLWVCPSDHDCPEPDQPFIVLDPGVAFGTGTHPTTALCLEWLGQHDLTNQTVIDYGCGSGILAVAAITLGASHVLAIDHDPQALVATQENALRNGMADKISTALPEDATMTPVDLLLANILAGPLQSLASTFDSLVKPEGMVVISGLLDTAAEQTSAVYTNWFKPQHTSEREGWMCLGFHKP